MKINSLNEHKGHTPSEAEKKWQGVIDGILSQFPEIDGGVTTDNGFGLIPPSIAVWRESDFRKVMRHFFEKAERVNGKYPHDRFFVRGMEIRYYL